MRDRGTKHWLRSTVKMTGYNIIRQQRCSQVIKSKSVLSLKSLSDKSESSLKYPEWCSSLHNSMTIEIHYDCNANWRYRFSKLVWHKQDVAAKGLVWNIRKQKQEQNRLTWRGRAGGGFGRGFMRLAHTHHLGRLGIMVTGKAIRLGGGVSLLRSLDPTWGRGISQLIATWAIGQVEYNWLPNWGKMGDN